MNNLRFLSIDGNPDVGIKAVADGVLDATFLYPTYGNRLLRTALSILAGDTVEREIAIPPMPAVDISNADIILRQDTLLNEETDKIQILQGELDNTLQNFSTQRCDSQKRRLQYAGRCYMGRIFLGRQLEHS